VLERDRGFQLHTSAWGFGLRKRWYQISHYLYDNAFVHAFLYEKKNGYFSFFLFSKERIRILGKQCIPPWFLLARRIALTAVMSIIQHDEEMVYKEQASGASRPFFLETVWFFLKLKWKWRGLLKWQTSWLIFRVFHWRNDRLLSGLETLTELLQELGNSAGDWMLQEGGDVQKPRLGGGNYVVLACVCVESNKGGVFVLLFPVFFKSSSLGSTFCIASRTCRYLSVMPFHVCLSSSGPLLESAAVAAPAPCGCSR
jgi:hypothetical protein